jgi:hypothetical protein
MSKMNAKNILLDMVCIAVGFSIVFLLLSSQHKNLMEEMDETEQFYHAQIYPDFARGYLLYTFTAIFFRMFLACRAIFFLQDYSVPTL